MDGCARAVYPAPCTAPVYTPGYTPPSTHSAPPLMHAHPLGSPRGGHRALEARNDVAGDDEHNNDDEDANDDDDDDDDDVDDGGRNVRMIG